MYNLDAKLVQAKEISKFIWIFLSTAKLSLWDNSSAKGAKHSFLAYCLAEPIRTFYERVSKKAVIELSCLCRPIVIRVG